MFHLHNGDSTADTMRAAQFPGTHFAFREALTTGPALQNVSQDAWFAARAQALAASSAQESAKVEQDLREQDATLAQLNQHDEIVLWFEHDLYCQVHLIYLLDNLARHPVAPARLSLICINAFPGKPDFRGLGELTAEQMASLFDSRHEITAAELELAQRAWAAYSAPDPQAVAALLSTNTSALPFLREALLLHLGRFPSVANGLSQAESSLLTLIANGQTNYVQLCHAFFNTMPTYGLGDLAIQDDLKRMSNVPHPLVALTGLSADNDWSTATCELTETGQQVLANTADFVKLNGIDHWLGGTHLTNENLWRWNEHLEKVERS